MAVHVHSHNSEGHTKRTLFGEEKDASAGRSSRTRRKSHSHDGAILVDDGRSVQISMETYRRLMDNGSQQSSLDGSRRPSHDHLVS